MKVNFRNKCKSEQYLCLYTAVEPSNATVVQATMAAALDITKNGFTLTQANGSNVTFQPSPVATTTAVAAAAPTNPTPPPNVLAPPSNPIPIIQQQHQSSQLKQEILADISTSAHVIINTTNVKKEMSNSR